MSESELHAQLVAATLTAIEAEHVGESLSIRADLSQTREHFASETMGGFRPDIVVRTLVSKRTIFAEAKTPRDIDTKHTRAQLKAFFEHLTMEYQGVLWMSVPLAHAGTAIRVAIEVRREFRLATVPLIVSGWLLGIRPWEHRYHG